MSVSIDLSNKVFLLCGASKGGISGATARMLADAGASLAIVDNQQSVLDATIADVEAAGAKCHGIVTDLLDPDKADKIIGEVMSAFGRLDGIANVAGGTRSEEWMPLEKTSTKMFRETLNYNLEYTFRICRDAAAAMIERKTPGAIVNVSSVSAIASAPFHGPYGAAKSGIVALTRTMAFEWYRYGIRANVVSPGAVHTDRTRAMVRDQIEPVDSSGVVFTSTDELANAIVFLLSDLASGISGQNLVVDSGLSTKFCAGTRTLTRPEG